MWVALCITLTFPPSGTARVEFKVGHGNYKKSPHVYLALHRSGPLARTSTRPDQLYRPMADFLKCR